MSKESLSWLNRNVLIGNTAQRGNAWHYAASEQGDEPNHYDGFIPVGDVVRRLFAWHAIERELFVSVPSDLDSGATSIDTSGQLYATIKVPNQKAIVADDTNEVLGIFKDGYQPHQYDEWLLTQVANLLDDDLGISSAGLLKNRAVAWVEVSVSETITTPEGVDFRPNLLAATSFDGSLATIYGRKVRATVCDNTLDAALGERGQSLKVRHSRYSHLRIAGAREALALVHQTADDFSAEVARLCSETVTERQWQSVLDALVPVPTEGKTTRGQTLAGAKRDALGTLYRSDARVSPWAGTSFGVLQAFNTYGAHLANVRGAERYERNQLAALSGRQTAADAEVLDTLRLVCA